MKRSGLFQGATVAALFFAACAAPTSESVENASTEAAGPVAPTPTAEALLALEREANEAYFKGDAASFAGLLNEPFVMLGADGARVLVLDLGAALFELRHGHVYPLQDVERLEPRHHDRHAVAPGDRRPRRRT